MSMERFKSSFKILLPVIFLAVLSILSVEGHKNGLQDKKTHSRLPRSISSMVAGMVYSAISTPNTQSTSVPSTNLVQSGSGSITHGAQYAAPYSGIPYYHQYQHQHQLAQSSDAVIDAIWNSNPDYRFTAANQLVVGNGDGIPNSNYAVSPYQNYQSSSQTVVQPLVATPLETPSTTQNGSSFDGYQLLSMGRDLVMDNLGLYMTALKRSMNRRKQKPKSKRRPKPKRRPSHVEYIDYSYEDGPEFEYY